MKTDELSIQKTNPEIIGLWCMNSWMVRMQQEKDNKIMEVELTLQLIILSSH